jgi:BCD family chlorophyll transporter-like MFS transporter
VPAWLVSLMVALPLVFAPFRALIGFRSDHPSLGPGLAAGSLHLDRHDAAVRRAGDHAVRAARPLGRQHGPPIYGQIGAALAFLLAGAGMHITQTAGLALATDIAPAHARPRVVALLYVMLLAGMLVSALGFGALLADFKQVKLIQVIQGAALLTMGLNLVALWKQEARNPGMRTAADGPRRDPVSRAWRAFMQRRSGQPPAGGTSAWAPPRSACRTSCSNPTAARSCTWPSAPPPR